MLSPRQWNDLLSLNPTLMDHRTWLAPLYAGHVRSMEMSEAAGLLKRAPLEWQRLGSLLPGNFAARVYSRVSDMFLHVNFERCRRFVMVGCGPLPGTLFNVVDSTDVPEIVGLDIDRHAISCVNEIARRCAIERIHAEPCDGRDFDYSQSDIVYVANLVTPKSSILARICETAASGTQIVLRDPVSAGELLSECGVEALDSRLAVLRDGESDHRFLSKHVFLMRR